MSIRTLISLLLGWGLTLPLAAAPPAFLLLDPAALAAYRTAYRAHHAPEATQVQAVLAAADQALAHAPYTVVTKVQVPPSGDKHDYMSQAPYVWPDPTKPDGRPYITKDGLTNPEAKALKDNEYLADVCHAVEKLALAYYFSHEEKYAAHAARLLRVFFLDPATRMNPNLNFGQGIPGTTTGRSYGIIQSRHLVIIPDALALLSGSPATTPALVQGLQAWLGQYTTWLTISPLGREEDAAKNNHGTFYDMQVLDFALFTGNQQLAKQTLEGQALARLPVQFAADGAQPLELARTRPWNYVTMNLQAWVALAVLAPHLGFDLWQYHAPGGQGLAQGVAWFKPYLLREKQMERPDVVPTSNATILVLYDLAGPHYAGLEAARVLAGYPDYVPKPWALLD